MATPDDAAFEKEFGSYKPATTSVPIRTIRPIIGGESAEAAEARRAEEARKGRGAEIEEERLDITKRGEKREIEERTFDRGTKLYDQFVGRTAVKNYEQAWPAFTSALSQPATTSGDRVLIYNAIKILDPEGAVPTGDIEGIQSQSPILQRIARDFGRLIDSGGTLPAQQRAELKEALEARVKTLRSPYELIRKDFERRSQNLNLDPLDTIGSRIDEADADIYQNYLQSLEAPAQGGGAVPVLKVAEGDRFSTDKDIEDATALQAAWAGGQSIEQLQALSKERNLKPLTPETIKALNEDPNRQIRFTPNRSGIREPSAPGMGTAAATAAIRGYTSNLGEEIVGAFSPEAAAKLQAAGEYGMENYPITSMLAEIPSSVFSPLNKVTKFVPGGPVVRDIFEGGIYGAGEGRPDASALERAKTAATGGILQSGFGAAARRFLPGGASPEGAGIPEGEFVNVTGEVPAGMVPEAPAGMAPEMPMGAAAPSAIPTGAPTGMAPPTAGMAPPIAGEAVEGVSAQIGSEEMINLAQKAVSRGPGASKARAQLAEMAKTNPEAKAAADRLGLELPVDVLSDNSQLKEVVGLTRAQIGSEAKQAWNETVQAASDRAHAAMDELDAVTDISQVSADVFNRLDNAQNSLGRQASDLRQEVTNAVDVRGRVDANGIKTWLQTRIDDLGGGKEGIASLSPEEKRLWGIVSKGQPTYALLNEQRDLIGQALEKGTGPWSNTNMKRLKDIYGSLADDQINFIEASAGKEIADKQRAANTLFKQMYEGREQMERIFTKNLSGSLAPLMQRAITQGTKGNVQTLNTLVNIIPEDMRGKVLTSALFKAAKATDDTFSFTNFANIYRDLRSNGEVYKQIAKAVGPEGDKLLTDLYAVSRRLSDADKAISRTGASTQLNLLNSERLLSRILMATGGAAGAGLIGSMLGGPGAAIVGAGLAAAAPEIAQRVGKTNAQKLHNLISSEPFRDLTVSAATGDALERNINRVAGSKQFRDYAKLVGIDMKDARNWLNSAISKGATIAGTEAVGSKPSEAPTVEMPQ